MGCHFHSCICRRTLSVAPYLRIVQTRPECEAQGSACHTTRSRLSVCRLAEAPQRLHLAMPFLRPRRPLLGRTCWVQSTVRCSLSTSYLEISTSDSTLQDRVFLGRIVELC